MRGAKISQYFWTSDSEMDFGGAIAGGRAFEGAWVGEVVLSLRKYENWLTCWGMHTVVWLHSYAKIGWEKGFDIGDNGLRMTFP